MCRREALHPLFCFLSLSPVIKVTETFSQSKWHAINGLGACDCVIGKKATIWV